MILFFDTESSDLINRRKPLDDPSQPWATHIAADLRNNDGSRVPGGFFSLRIRAEEGRSISAGAEAVHGVSTRDAARTGINEKAALGALIGLAKVAETIVGHGVEFDKTLILSLLMRGNGSEAMRTWNSPRRRWICTMKEATQICAIPSTTVADTFKWPSLDEATARLCELPPRPDKHDPWDDVQRTAALYFALLKRGLLFDMLAPIELPNDPAFGFLPVLEMTDG